MKTNIKKYLIVSSTLLTISISLWGGWNLKEWVDKRDNMLIQYGYDKAIDEANLQNKWREEKEKQALETSCFNLSKNQEVNRLLKKYFPTCQEAKTAYAIAHAECKGKQTCNNRGLNRDGSIDFGYMQVNSVHRNKGESIAHFEARMYNLEENIKLAAKVYKDRKLAVGDGFTAWSTYQNKKYLAYMK